MWDLFLVITKNRRGFTPALVLGEKSPSEKEIENEYILIRECPRQQGVG